MSTEETIAALDRGEIRVAEKLDGEWRVNEDAKAAILDYFRIAQDGADRGRAVRVPRQDPAQARLRRSSACASCRRRRRATARSSRAGVVLMPSYVNIGAWVGPEHDGRHVGDRRLVRADRRATSTSPAASGIGGVLEPPQARPVIVEDGAFIGSRCILTEGVRDRRARPCSRRTSRSTASVPVIDVTGPEPVEHRGYVPPRSVVVPGTRPKEFPAGTYQLACALIIGRRSESDRPEDVAERRAARVRDRLLAVQVAPPAR